MASRADFIQDGGAGKDLVEQQGSRSRRAGEFLGRRGREPGSRRGEGMTVKELLEECREEMHTALILQRRREELTMMLLPKSTTPRIDVIPGKKDISDPLAKYVVQLLQMDARLARQQAKILQKHTMADKYIDTLPKELWKQALTIYYMTFRWYERTVTYPSGQTKQIMIRGLHSWETTAEELGKTPKTIYRILNELNKNFMKRGVNVSVKK